MHRPNFLLLQMATTSKPRSASGAQTNALTQAVELLISRIEKTESDISTHMTKVENRLDQLVDLTRSVAVLQESNSRNADTINEIRGTIKENNEKLSTSISRAHTRIDESSEVCRSKTELQLKEVSVKMEINENRIDETEKEFKMWLNRGVGAWALFVVILGLIQFFGFRWIDSIEKERSVVLQDIARNYKDIDKHSNQLENILTVTRDTTTAVKRNEQQLLDIEKQLDYLRANSASKR